MAAHSERMNILIAELQRSLAELDLGLAGELQMSERMEALQNALYLNKACHIDARTTLKMISIIALQVPESWSRLAYPSQLGLGAWYAFPASSRRSIHLSVCFTQGREPDPAREPAV